MRTPTRNAACASTERAKTVTSSTLARKSSLDRDGNIGNEEKLILVHSRSHHGFMMLDNEKYGVKYYLWESEGRDGGGEIMERSVVFWQPGIPEGEGARPDRAFTIDYEKLGKQPALSDFVLPKEGKL